MIKCAKWLENTFFPWMYYVVKDTNNHKGKKKKGVW